MVMHALAVTRYMYMLVDIDYFYYLSMSDCAHAMRALVTSSALVGVCAIIDYMS